MYHPSCTTSLLGRETHTRRAPQELRVSKAGTIFRKNGARSRLGSNAAVRNGSYSQVESLCTNTGNPAPQQPQNKEGVDLLDHARRLGGGETLESAQGLWGARDRERQARRSVLRHVRRVGATRSGTPEFLATPLKPHCQQTPRAPRLPGCPRLPRKRRALTFSVMPDD